MAKANEINYIRQVARVEGVPEESFRRYLMDKPFSDPRCGEYLMDIAQVMRLLPPPPARLLDVGVGSGWTSALFALRGYEVLGLDISPDMIGLASQRSGSAKFAVCDYESGPMPTGFDVAVIYDALHHAEDEAAVMRNVHAALSERGMLVTVEPGAGHSRAPESLEVMRKYGTTEKDMPYEIQRRLMLDAGFSTVEQYIRLSQLPVDDVSVLRGSLGQVRHGLSLVYGSATGLTSIVVARKVPGWSRAAGESESGNAARNPEVLMRLAVAHDEFASRCESQRAERGADGH